MQLYEFIQPPKELLKNSQVAQHLYNERWPTLHFQGEEPTNSYRSVHKSEHQRMLFEGSLEDLFAASPQIVYDRRVSAPSDFESRFECGNLLMAKLTSHPNHYLLRLQEDTNTTGYCMWFFFRFYNRRKHEQLRFDVVNLHKNYSLFARGMKACVYSTRNYQQNKVGWLRATSCNDYFRNGLVSNNRELHSLHFEYQCQFDDDEIYFSYCYPYLYTDVHRLMRWAESRIQHKQTEQKDSGFMEAAVTTVGRSLAGNSVQCITLGSKRKPLLLIMARVHPSETISSFVMEGIVRALLSDEPQARFLLAQCRVALIPMLNPDGVIHGNTRSSYAGCDLNRRWLKPTKQLHPQLLAVKRHIKRLLSQCSKTLLCLDLHGHSGKENLFFYGCQGLAGIYEVRQFPTIMCRLSEVFNPKSCCYYVQEDRLATARVTLAPEFQGLSYTLEASLMGSSVNVAHFQQKDYANFGRMLVKGLAIYRSFTVAGDQSVFQAGFNRKLLMSEIKQAISEEETHERNTDDSSDSDKSNFNLPESVVAANVVRSMYRNGNLCHMRRSIKRQKSTAHSRVRKHTEVQSARQSETLEKRRDAPQNEYLFNFRIRKQARERLLQ